jgi:hypothetical protein
LGKAPRLALVSAEQPGVPTEVRSTPGSTTVSPKKKNADVEAPQLSSWSCQTEAQAGRVAAQRERRRPAPRQRSSAGKQSTNTCASGNWAPVLTEKQPTQPRGSGIEASGSGARQPPPVPYSRR